MMLKLLLRIILASFPVIFVVASINYLVDPALTLRNSEFERLVASGILDNKNVGITTNYNERKVQKLIIEGMSIPPDGIVVGSSRIMSIPLDTIGLENGFCNGVSGAVIEDIIGIIGMYDIRSMLPKIVCIGIDPWLFNDNHGDTRYYTLIPDYNSFSDKLNLEKIPLGLQSNSWYSKLEQAISPTYFQSSIKSILKDGIRIEQPAPLITTGLYSEYNNKLADGSVIYNQENNDRSGNAIEQSVITTINRGSYYHSLNYRELSPTIMNQFKRLVGFLQSNDVTVIFILPPLHPLFYSHIAENPDYQLLTESEVFIRKYAEERGIPIIGSVNPESIGATNDDFYDFMHPKREFMANMCMTSLNFPVSGL